MRRRYLMVLFLVPALASPAFALITGGKGEPTKVRGFPSGSLPLANLKTRIAWWEGPPFGGGQYHFDYSGRTDDLQQAIDLFAKVDSKRKQVVVREGQQSSFWLDLHDKKTKHPIDWQFVVWVPKNWQHLNNAKAGLLPPGEEGDSPMTTLFIFVTDRIEWESLRIPRGLRVVDERLAANGITAGQGAALRGRVVDPQGNPIEGATVTVGKEANERKGTSDDKGQFLITKIPEGTHQIVVLADRFASKDAYYHSFHRLNCQQLEVTLATAAKVTVRVVDQQDDPLPGVKIRVTNCKDQQGNHYRVAGTQQFETNDKGEFVLSDVPEGSIKFMSRTREYYYNSVLNEHDTNRSPIILKLQQTGTVQISVFASDGEPITSKYMVEIAEAGVDLTKGGGVGSWGGSANIGEDGTFTFENIPPGHYVVTGKPNPGRGNDRTGPIKVEIEGKDRHSIKLIAK
ncbi:MAG: carboxypeptidase-like regulatory domain-containing protein [Fuerstiella sp.]